MTLKEYKLTGNVFVEMIKPADTASESDSVITIGMSIPQAMKYLTENSEESK